MGKLKLGHDQDESENRLPTSRGGDTEGDCDRSGTSVMWLDVICIPCAEARRARVDSNRL